MCRVDLTVETIVLDHGAEIDTEMAVHLTGEAEVVIEVLGTRVGLIVREVENALEDLAAKRGVGDPEVGVKIVDLIVERGTRGQGRDQWKISHKTVNK